MSTHAPRERGPVGFPPPVVYVSGLLAALALESVAPTPNLPGAVRVGLILAAVAAMVLLDGRAIVIFRRKRTGIAPWHPTTHLVTDGPYRISRNPMYLGMTVTYTALVLTFGWLWGLAMLPLALLVIDRLVIRREEAYLEDKYGEEYRRYRGSVRRWF